MNRLILIILITTGLASCQESKLNESNIKLNKAVRVQVEKVRLSGDSQKLNYSGTIESSQVIPLTFQTNGTIGKIYVEEGDFVKEGQLLAVADKQNMQNAYNSSLAQYEQAIDARSRLKKVYDAGSLPEVKWVEIESKVVQARSNMEIVKKNLDNCEMHAPSDGYIGKRNIEPGMSALQVQAPIELVNIETVYAKISIPENEIGMFEKGLETNIQVSALNNRQYSGKVEHVGVVAKRLSRTYDVKISIENTELKLKPGMVCEVDVIIPISESVLTVPMAAVDRDENNTNYVYTVHPNSKNAVKKPIQIEGIVNNRIAVSSGINANELVIVKGIQKISNNSEVSW